jgi:hypothetical protein
MGSSKTKKSNARNRQKKKQRKAEAQTSEDVGTLAGTQRDRVRGVLSANQNNQHPSL